MLGWPVTIPSASASCKLVTDKVHEGCGKAEQFKRAFAHLADRVAAGAISPSNRQSTLGDKASAPVDIKPKSVAPTTAHLILVVTRAPSLPSARDSHGRRRKSAIASSDWMLRNPITGIVGCCALAASGHTTTPPINVMNSRRLTDTPMPKITHYHIVG